MAKFAELLTIRVLEQMKRSWGLLAATMATIGIVSITSVVVGLRSDQKELTIDIEHSQFLPASQQSPGLHLNKLTIKGGEEPTYALSLDIDLISPPDRFYVTPEHFRQFAYLDSSRFKLSLPLGAVLRPHEIVSIFFLSHKPAHIISRETLLRGFRAYRTVEVASGQKDAFALRPSSNWLLSATVILVLVFLTQLGSILGRFVFRLLRDNNKLKDNL